MWDLSLLTHYPVHASIDFQRFPVFAVGSGFASRLLIVLPLFNATNMLITLPKVGILT